MNSLVFSLPSIENQIRIPVALVPIREGAEIFRPPLATAHQLMKTGGLWNAFVTSGYASAFLKLLTGTVPSVVSEISKALTKGDPDAAYRDMGSIDFSKHVLSQDQRPLPVIQDEVSGWADLGNPVRVIETLIRNRIEASWLRKIRDVPHLLKKITVVGPSDQTAY